MRTLPRGKTTLLFVTFAVLLSVGGTALALTTGLSGIADPLSGITGLTSLTDTSGTASPTVVSSQADFAPDASGTTNASGATTPPSPTIASDRDDYAPGELVTLTGGGWRPGEPVSIKVNDAYGASWSRNVEVTADASGRITDSFNLPDWFVSDYDVTATAAQSGTATTTFTDGNASSVTGAVTDIVTHQPISGATVTCAPSGGCNGTVTTTTNASGVYFFDGGTGSPKLT